MKKTSIAHAGNEHSDWLRSLDFYKTEIGFLKERLTEIAGKNTGKDVEKLIEHYENQFNLQTTNIDTLRNTIDKNLEIMGEEAQNTNGYVDKELLNQYHSLRNDFYSEERVILDLRHEFNRFAAEWM